MYDITIDDFPPDRLAAIVHWPDTSAPHLQDRCRRADIETHADRLGQTARTVPRPPASHRRRHRGPLQ
jgi:hypothetical protein